MIIQKFNILFIGILKMDQRRQRGRNEIERQIDFLEWKKKVFRLKKPSMSPVHEVLEVTLTVFS